MFRSIVQFFLLGLGMGGVYVLAAQGLVLVYRGSGIINFANGGFALIGAYAEYELARLHVPEVPAIGLALGICGVAGDLTHILIIRRMKAAAQLIKLIATLGVVELLAGAFALHYGTDVVFPPFPMPNRTLHLVGEPVGLYYLLVLLVSAAVSFTLWAGYKYTKFGLKTTAVAENPRATSALGHSPDRLAAWNWALGAALAGLGGALLAPIIGLSVTSITLLLIPSLASALLGSFSSFSLTFLGGMVIGVCESEVQRSTTQIGLPEVVPLLIVVAMLVVRGSSLPTRGSVSLRLPRVGSGRVPWRTMVPGVIITAVVCLVVSSSAAVALISSLSASIILVSSIVVTGYAGQLSLAQLGIAGIGAFGAARAAEALGVNFWVAMLIGIIGVLPIGVLLGLPALRTRGVNLAIVTLAFGVIVSDVIFANPTFTGGASGTSVRTPYFFGIDMNAEVHPQRYAVMVLAILVICGLAVLNLRRGSVGRRLIAVRNNERAAATLGVSVPGSKLYAFALAASIATIGGVLIAYQASSVSWSSGWDVFTGITLLSAAVIGGIGYVGGSILGGIVAGAGIATYVFSSMGIGAQSSIGPASGLLLILAIITMPDGAIAAFEGRHPRFWVRPTGREPRGGFQPSPEPPALADFLGVNKAVQRSTPDNRLTVEGLTVAFGGVVALQDVSLEVTSGEIVGLIGPNGAGKTTLIDCVTGITRRYKGHIALDGRGLDGLGPTRRARLGLSRSFQALELFDDLTVEENLRVAAERPSAFRYVTELAWPVRHPLPKSCLAAVEEFGLASDLVRSPRELPFGRRRLVGIVRAVAASPKILLLDEPAAGLDQVESEEMVRLLRSLAERWGLGILLVEHDMALVMGACDRIVALDFGRIIASGTPEEVRHDPAVIGAYLGVTEAEAVPTAPPSRYGPTGTPGGI